METNNQSALAPVVNSVVQSLLIERGMNVGRKVLQGKQVNEKDVVSLGALLILFLVINQSK